MSKTTKTSSRRGSIDTKMVRQLQRERRIEWAQRADGGHRTPLPRPAAALRRDGELIRFLELTRHARPRLPDAPRRAPAQHRSAAASRASFAAGDRRGNDHHRR